MSLRAHVGLPRCGSTWLQQVVLPHAGLPFGTGWGEADGEDSELSKLAALMGDELQSRHQSEVHPTMTSDGVISHELAVCAAWRRQATVMPISVRLDRLVKLLGADKAKILLIRRSRTDSLVDSLYGEYLRLGGRRGKGAFRREILNEELLDHDYVEFAVRTSFDRVHVLVLEDLSLRPSQFMRGLEDWLETPLEPSLVTMKVNKSVSRRRRMLMRAYNNVLQQCNIEEPSKYAGWCKSHAAGIQALRLRLYEGLTK